MALDFVAGCLGGCAGVLVGHPLDTIKVHLQTQDAKNPRYRGTFHCMKTIVAKDSVRGLYRGMTSPMGGVAFVNAIVFGVYGNIQRNVSDPDSIRAHFLAGSAAGLVQSLVCSPMELAKMRLQLQNNFKGGTKFKGPLQCLRHIHRTEGVRGLFRGLGMTAIRDVPGFATYFAAYELMIRQIENPTAFHTLMAGGLAGIVSWLFGFPMDVVKSCLQADGIGSRPKYNGILDCMRKGYQAEGLSFYCRGLSSTLLRAFPMNAACFLVVSWIMKLAEKVHLDVEIQPVEQLAMVGATCTPIVHPHTHVVEHDKHHKDTQMTISRMIKSMTFLSAFSEAVCHSEIVELVHDHYANDHDSYYIFDENRISGQVQ